MGNTEEAEVYEHLGAPCQECMKKNVLDTIINVVCKKYGVYPEDLNKKTPGGRCTRAVASAKRAISYLNPIFSQVDYKILMERLGYGKKTQSRHTRNRKEVLADLKKDKEYKIEINEIKKTINDILVAEMIADIENLLKRHHMEVSIIVQARGTVTSLSRGTHV